MASGSRRPVISFSLSFLDVMFCGFGAVVLLVLIINSSITTSRQARVEDRRLELMKQEMLTRQMKTVELQLQQHLDALAAEVTVLETEQTRLNAENRTIQASIARDYAAADSKEEIKALQLELQALEQEKLLLEARKALENERARNIRSFAGNGDRQYLTGLKLGGQRVLILVDSSASMLDRKIVDIVRRKVLDENTRREAPKWRKTIATVEWLLAKLPLYSSVQLYRFNTDVTSLAPEQNKTWVKITDEAAIDHMVQELKRVAPSAGTNLESVFLQARTLSPPPDNIILLTDGLPTQGKRFTGALTISGKDRVRLFEQAAKQLPGKVPVNTILFPVEGDPMAAVLYWKLAIESGGSFFTPTRDWP